MRLTSKEARELLEQERNKSKDDRWIDHCICVGDSAGIIAKALQEIPGVEVAVPHGAFYCVAKFPVKSAEDFSKWLLEEFDLDKKTVMLAPAAGFYSTPGKGQNEARMAYVLKQEDLIESAKVLKRALEVYKEVEK